MVSQLQMLEPFWTRQSSLHEKLRQSEEAGLILTGKTVRSQGVIILSHQEFVSCGFCPTQDRLA